jgi:uncharacterized LabA/DUF88 family protein
MLSYPSERLCLFIDGRNLYKSAQALDFDVDYKRIRELFSKRGILIRSSFYTLIVSQDDTEFLAIKPLIDYLAYNGFNVVTKQAGFQLDPEGKKRPRGNVHVEMVCDMISAAQFCDHIVLFSGDDSFTYAVKMIQQMGKRVTVVSTKEVSPVHVADGLRRQTDNFVDLADIKTSIEKAV